MAKSILCIMIKTRKLKILKKLKMMKRNFCRHMMLKAVKVSGKTRVYHKMSPRNIFVA